ncbi:putative transcription factor WD40-like family [Rosa chinensis]|uniref:Putative transcription factor WD40-like family n=1 Tax=Rosa chinensis TaxID=74649 RepID=A0A2P6P4V9_ROSCH|nr:putative transcription factor WD40-like family [Rosa chinensis]
MLEFHAFQLFDKMPNSEGLCDARRIGLCNAGRTIMAPMSIRDKEGGLATPCEVVDASDYLGYPKARSEVHCTIHLAAVSEIAICFVSCKQDNGGFIEDKELEQSLSGHTSGIDSVSFDSSEVLVVAGAASGTIKLWDLEEAKIVYTLTGYRSNCIFVDFDPFGALFASGSLDTNLKIWDIRKKGCIHTYKGHTRGVNAIRFTPDGRWAVSGGEDNTVKLWDLTDGKLLHDFKCNEGQIQCIGFHPHEFLLATGSADGTDSFDNTLVDAVVDFLKSNATLYFMRYTSNALLSKDNYVGFLTNMYKLFRHMVGHVHKDELFMATCFSISHPPFHALVKKLSLFLPMVAIQSLQPLLADILREDAQFIFGIMRVVHIIFQDGWLLIHEQERGLAKSTIIAGYCQAGYVEKAFEYLWWMRMDVPNPNEYAFTRVPSVCGTMAMLAQGKQLHAHVLTVVLDCEAMVQSALVNLHLKCGSSQEAAKIFDVTKVDDHLFDLYIIFIEPLIACYLRYIDKHLSHGRYEDGHATVSSTIMNEEKFMFVTIDKLCTALVFKCCPIGIVEVSEKWFLDVMNMNLETMVGKIKYGREKRLHMDLFKIHRGPLEKCLGYTLPTLDAICLCAQKLFLVDWAFADVPISWKDVETKLFALYFPNFMIAFIEFGFVAIDVGALALVPQIHFSVHMWTNEALLLVLLSAIMHSQTMEFVISSILLQSPNREALRVFSNMQNLYHRQSNFISQVCVHLCALLHAWQVTTDDGYLQLDDKLGCDLMTMDNESELVMYTGCQTPQICWSITYESRKSNNNISVKTCSVSLVSNSLNLYLTILLPYGIFEVGEDSVSGIFYWQLLLDLVRKMLQIWTWENGGFLQTQMIVEARDFQKKEQCVVINWSIALQVSKDM